MIPEYFILPEKFDTSKKELIAVVMTLYVSVLGERSLEYFDIAKSFNMNQLAHSFDMLMEECPQYSGKVKSAIKKLYNSSSWFGISSEAKMRFLYDLRAEILR